jgi:hypothetical protein
VDVSIEIRVRFRDGERRDERDRREDAGRCHHRMAGGGKVSRKKFNAAARTLPRSTGSVMP